jgi:hypothetical protein
MFIVTIDIWPHGNAAAPQTQLTIVAANDGSEHGRYGSYDAIVLRGPIVTESDRWAARQDLIDAIDAGKTARVEHFPRGNDQAHLGSLAAALIEALGLGEYLAHA